MIAYCCKTRRMKIHAVSEDTVRTTVSDVRRIDHRKIGPLVLVQ